MKTHPHLTFRRGDRIVRLEILPNLIYMATPPARYRVALYDARSAEMVAECRYAVPAQARRAFSRRVRALLGDVPGRCRALRRYARAQIADARAVSRRLRVSLRSFPELAAQGLALRDKCLLRAQVADANAAAALAGRS